MPGFDRTGPRGEGPMTGGGYGYCVGRVAEPRGVFRGGGRGWGRGAGRGGGRGRCWFPRRWAGAYAPQDEIAWLRAQESGLRSDLESVQRRLAALEENQSPED